MAGRRPRSDKELVRGHSNVAVICRAIRLAVFVLAEFAARSRHSLSRCIGVLPVSVCRVANPKPIETVVPRDGTRLGSTLTISGARDVPRWLQLNLER